MFGLCVSRTIESLSASNNPHFTYEDTLYFTADSAALISKGMVCMLADVFSNSTRSDIGSFEEKELNGLNLQTLLTPGRRNGVYSMLKVIRSYGLRKDQASQP